MSERSITDRVTDALKKRGAWFFKVHGGPWQRAGVPDVVGIYRGIGFGLEIKIPGKAATPIQAREIEAIRAAGGEAGVIHSPEEAAAVLDAIDRRLA